MAPRAAVGDAELVISELVTNAIRAGCAEVSVHLVIEDECLRIGVEDQAPGLPRRREAANTDVTGRGLGIVSALASDWGVRSTSVGKEVWAAIQFG
jgi:anti-sigma regulatory factor (Ser/Thr protein kinase)